MGHTWIHNPETGGYWQCPDDALDHFIQRGWELCEPPPEPNPAIAEMLAWRAAQAAKQENKPTKPRRGASTEESES